MIKKVIIFTFTFFLLASSCSCGRSSAIEYAKEHGQICVEIVEDYLAGNLTWESAHDKLSVQESLIRKNIEEIETENGHYPYADSLVATYVSSCSVAIFLNGSGSKSKSHVEEKLKDLKKATK